VPIDAPFNIFGMPFFLGYYVTHSWGSNSFIEIGPHSDSNKPEVEMVGLEYEMPA